MANMKQKTYTSEFSKLIDETNEMVMSEGKDNFEKFGKSINTFTVQKLMDNEYISQEDYKDIFSRIRSGVLKEDKANVVDKGTLTNLMQTGVIDKNKFADIVADPNTEIEDTKKDANGNPIPGTTPTVTEDADQDDVDYSGFGDDDKEAMDADAEDEVDDDHTASEDPENEGLALITEDEPSDKEDKCEGCDKAKDKCTCDEDEDLDEAVKKRTYADMIKRKKGKKMKESKLPADWKEKLKSMKLSPAWKAKIKSGLATAGDIAELLSRVVLPVPVVQTREPKKYNSEGIKENRDQHGHAAGKKFDAEVNAINSFMEDTTEEFDDWDWDGTELVVFLDDEVIERYSYDDLAESGVFDHIMHEAKDTKDDDDDEDVDDSYYADDDEDEESDKQRDIDATRKKKDIKENRIENKYIWQSMQDVMADYIAYMGEGDSDTKKAGNKDLIKRNEKDQKAAIKKVADDYDMPKDDVEEILQRHNLIKEGYLKGSPDISDAEWEDIQRRKRLEREKYEKELEAKAAKAEKARLRKLTPAQREAEKRIENYAKEDWEAIYNWAIKEFGLWDVESTWEGDILWIPDEGEWTGDELVKMGVLKDRRKLANKKKLGDLVNKENPTAVNTHMQEGKESQSPAAAALAKGGKRGLLAFIKSKNFGIPMAIFKMAMEGGGTDPEDVAAGFDMEGTLDKYNNKGYWDKYEDALDVDGIGDALESLEDDDDDDMDESVHYRKLKEQDLNKKALGSKTWDTVKSAAGAGLKTVDAMATGGLGNAAYQAAKPLGTKQGTTNKDTVKRAANQTPAPSEANPWKVSDECRFPNPKTQQLEWGKVIGLYQGRNDVVAIENKSGEKFSVYVKSLRKIRENAMLDTKGNKTITEVDSGFGGGHGEDDRPESDEKAAFDKPDEDWNNVGDEVDDEDGLASGMANLYDFMLKNWGKSDKPAKKKKVKEDMSGFPGGKYPPYRIAFKDGNVQDAYSEDDAEKIVKPVIKNVKFVIITGNGTSKNYQPYLNNDGLVQFQLIKESVDVTEDIIADINNPDLSNKQVMEKNNVSSEEFYKILDRLVSQQRSQAAVKRNKYN